MKPQEDFTKVAKEISEIPGVNAVYLFGSYARGKQKPHSDIDLCAITETRISKKTKNKILSLASKKIETHILSDLPLYIQFSVFKEGKPIFVNSEDSLNEIKWKTIRLYLDFQPRLERHYRRILNEKFNEAT